MSLEVLLAGAHASAASPIYTTYHDQTATSYGVGATTRTNTNGTTAVTAAAAPGASGTTREIDLFNLRNSDTAAITATVRINDNGSFYILNRATLAVGDVLFYTHAGGWQVQDASGQIRTVYSLVAAASQAEMEAASSLTTFVTPGRTQYHPGVAKAWAKWTVSGGTVTTEASHNVSSITDGGTGDLTVNFSTAFSAATYAVGSMASTNSSGAGTEYCIVGFHASTAPATGSCRLITVRIGTQDAQDTNHGSVAFFGDQA